MAQRFSRQPFHDSPEPFSEVQDPTLTSGLFWARLLTYRPLFLLGGLWLILVCTSAIAYHGLFSEPAENTVYTEAPLSVVETPPAELSASSAPYASIGSDNSAPDNSASSSGTVALWGLISLVGLCSFGCLVLTQQIKASARPTKRKKPRPRPVVKAPMPVQPPQPKRLAPYSPQRDGVVVPGARIVETPLAEPPARRRPSISGQPGPTAATMPLVSGTLLRTGRLVQASRPVQTDGLAVAPTPNRQPAVVPPEADLPLDWTEGSVAHALDVRQRRSLSSFM